MTGSAAADSVPNGSIEAAPAISTHRRVNFLRVAGDDQPAGTAAPFRVGRRTPRKRKGRRRRRCRHLVELIIVAAAASPARHAAG